MKTYSFYLKSGKYPKHIGYGKGKDKKDAFESLKKEHNYSDKLKLGKKVSGHICK